jgi:diguanylate cyclase (GGDEF)-like protein
MNFSTNLILNVYSIIFLAVIIFYASKNKEENSLQYKLFAVMMYITVLMLIIDILGRFDGNPHTIYSLINHVGNFLVFASSPLLPSLWILYVYTRIFNNKKIHKKLLYSLIIINSAVVLLVICSQFFGWVYTISADNIYSRGPFFMVPVSIAMLLLLAADVMIMIHEKKIDNKKYYNALLFFTIPPFICVILQSMVYGISLIYNGVVISVLVVYLYIQNQSIHTDYLTGISNRKKLDAYLKQKIAACACGNAFSAIIVDIDNFKSINDTFGHTVGDIALDETVSLIQSCLRKSDFIARFGGDEFFIVLNITNKNDLCAMVKRIEKRLKEFNKTSNKPYSIELSMGYAVYDINSSMDYKDFIKYIDTLMYENKRINKNE